jgi:hypothetical protein
MEMINKASSAFAEVFNQIPELYREKYGIKLITANEFTKFPVLYAEIREAKLSIIPNGKDITINEREGKLIIDIEGSGKVHMYKNYTLIYTLL